MSAPVPVLVPLVNPNETESILADLKVHEGQKVGKGDVIAEFETTKSTAELAVDRDGYVLGMKSKPGDTLHAGQRLCYLAEELDAPLPAEPEKPELTVEKIAVELPQDLRITRPARELAERLGLTLDNLPRGTLVTEAVINSLAGTRLAERQDISIVIYGGGGHAKSLIDLIRAEGTYEIAGILDDGIPAGTCILDVPVLGGGEMLGSLQARGIHLAVNAVGGIGSITPRLAVYQKLEQAGFSVVTVTHPRAYVEPTASIAEGCQLFFNSYIGSDVQVGFGSIINTGAIISHDCRLGAYSNVSPGAILAGAVTLGERVLVGMGVTINLGVKVGAGARIGNSAVVKADVPENGIVHAGSVWPVQV